jgi:hypothetical protein
VADNILLDWPPDKRIYNPPIPIYYQLVQGISVVCRWYVAHTRGPAPASRWQKCPQNAEFLGVRTGGEEQSFFVDQGECCAIGRGTWLTTFAPILISFSFKLVSDQSLIGSGVASVRRKLPSRAKASSI